MRDFIGQSQRACSTASRRPSSAIPGPGKTQSQGRPAGVGVGRHARHELFRRHWATPVHAGQGGRAHLAHGAGPPSRDYIVGEELRARAELGVPDDVGAADHQPAAEGRAGAARLQHDHRHAGDHRRPRLPEEMRWLAMYDEVGWEGPPRPSGRAMRCSRASANTRWPGSTTTWSSSSWPAGAGPLPTVPFMIVLLRGKCYLRMQYLPAETSTLDHATDLFVGACEARSKRSGNEKRPAGPPGEPAEPRVTAPGTAFRVLAVGAVLAQLPLGDGVAVHLVRAVGEAQRARVRVGLRQREGAGRRRRRAPASPSRSPGRPCSAPPP